MRSGLLGVAGVVSAMPSSDLAAAGRAMSGLVQLAKAQQAVACITNAAGPNHMALARAAGVRFAASSIANGGVSVGCPALDGEAMSQAA